VYTQISLFLGAFSLHIAIASLIACSSASVVVILSETLVALLNLTGPCVNITAVPVPVSAPAIFFRICDASVRVTREKEAKQNFCERTMIRKKKG